MQGTNARCPLEKVFVFGVWGAVIDINHFQYCNMFLLKS